jgi:hypothetical protein
MIEKKFKFKFNIEETSREETKGEIEPVIGLPNIEFLTDFDIEFQSFKLTSISGCQSRWQGAAALA